MRARPARPQPPGPPGEFLLGNLRAFAGDVLGFFTRCAREYGPVVRLRFGPREAWLLTDPADIEYVLVQNHRDFIKHSWFWRHVTAVFGRGLLTNEGDDWLRQRRLIQPAFHRERIAAYGETMIAVTERYLDAWRVDETRDLHSEMLALTMQIVARVLFDAEVKQDVADIGAAFEEALQEISARFRRPLPMPDWLPLPGTLRYNRAVRKLDALVYRFLREHRQRENPGTDVLAMLMAARTPEGQPMPDRQIRDEVVTLLLAGHETTALTLSWTWALLAEHPEAADRLAAELHERIGDRPLRVADAQNLPWTAAVINEAIRLFPPAHTIGREARQDCVVHGYPAPAGTTFFIVPWVMHRDPRWFDAPDEFRPERWLDGLEERLPRYVYIPFGGGPRLCIGNRFALLEAQLLLALLARRFRPCLEPHVFPQHFASVTLRPARGLPVRLAAASAMRGSAGPAQA